MNGIDTSRPNIARVWDFLVGGKNHYQADRVEAARLLEIEPNLHKLAQWNRVFLRRTVYWLAFDCGIRQFLDLGSGLPTASDLHEVAQDAASASRFVYVDNDLVAAAHTNALRVNGNGRVTAVLADLADPAAVLDSPEVAQALDLTQPVAVILGMVLHFFDAGHAAKIVAGYADAIVPGSYVVLSCGSGDEATGGRIAREYRPHALHNHAREQITGFLAGLSIIPPGLADAASWVAGVPCEPPSSDGLHVLAAVARKDG